MTGRCDQRSPHFQPSLKLDLLIITPLPHENCMLSCMLHENVRPSCTAASSRHPFYASRPIRVDSFLHFRLLSPESASWPLLATTFLRGISASHYVSLRRSPTLHHVSPPVVISVHSCALRYPPCSCIWAIHDCDRPSSHGAICTLETSLTTLLSQKSQVNTLLIVFSNHQHEGH